MPTIFLFQESPCSACGTKESLINACTDKSSLVSTTFNMPYDATLSF